MATFMATSINESPVISEKAGAVLADVRGKAVKFDETGAVVLAAAGDKMILGVGIMTNDVEIAAGRDVDIQIKDIGLVQAGGTITKGAQLEVGSDGKFVAGTTAPVAIALEAATADGVYIKAIIK